MTLVTSSIKTHFMVSLLRINPFFGTLLLLILVLLELSRVLYLVDSDFLVLEPGSASLCIDFKVIQTLGWVRVNLIIVDTVKSLGTSFVRDIQMRAVRCLNCYYQTLIVFGRAHRVLTFIPQGQLLEVLVCNERVLRVLRIVEDIFLLFLQLGYETVKFRFNFLNLGLLVFES